MEYNGENYEIKLNIKTIKQIEQALGKGIISIIQASNGMLSIAELTTIAGYGMHNSAGNRISPVQGVEIAEAYLMEHGYAELITIVIKAIERDCPFFFQAD